MTKDELLEKLKEICPDAIISKSESGDDELVIAIGLVEPEEGAELISVNDYVGTPRELTERTVHYFAEDGNYGDANGLVIIETTDWTEKDWDMFEDHRDWERPKAAEKIANKYKDKK